MSQYCDLPISNNYDQPRRWLVSDLWKMSETMNTEFESVDKLWSRYSKVFCWTLYGEEVDNEFFLHHMERILNADLSYPIILSEEGYIMDGVHRLLKCKFLKKDTISCVKFKKDPPSTK
jgi:disulfide oxidoreductase YuzD